MSATASCSDVRLLTLKLRRSGASTDEALKAKHLATLNKKLAVLAEILGKQRYIAGDVRTRFAVKLRVGAELSFSRNSLLYVDLFHLPLGHTVQELGKTNVLDVEERPNVAR